MMNVFKRIVSTLLLPGTLILMAGCSSGGEQTASSSIASGSGTDFFHLAVVPYQTVATATFEVQVIAENIDPDAPPITPVVIDASGNSHTMSQKMLTWPGTATDSVMVYAVVVPLLANQVNNLKAVSGSKEIQFSIRHKSALNIQSAGDATTLRNLIRNANTDPAVDVIEVDYAEGDIGAILHNIVSSGSSTRSTWLTVRPGAGSITWNRDYPGSPSTYRRPFFDLLNLEGVTFGSAGSDGGGYQYYAEPGHRVWLSNVAFRAKYNITWPRDTIVTAAYLADIRVDPVEAQKVYFTGCTWSGTASNAATQHAQLARDLFFSSHRGDINQFGKVVLNVSAENMFAVRTVADNPSLPGEQGDFTHNDGFQVWGSASNIAIKGIRVTSPNVQAYLQPFLFDRTNTPNYSYVLLDKVVIEGASPAGLGAPTTVDRAQLAGVISNSRISNIIFPEQALTIRQDFTEPNGAFAPSNVRIHNVIVWGIEYSPPLPATGIVYNSNYGTVGAYPGDISAILNAVPRLSGATFSYIAVK